MQYKEWSYRLGELVLGSYSTERSEIREVVRSIDFNQVVAEASNAVKRSKKGKVPVRTALNGSFEKEFLQRGWKGGKGGVRVFSAEGPDTKVDFMKGRIAVEVAFSHSDFLANDMLKFQMLSYAHLDKIDVGVHIVITKELMENYPNVNFEGSVDFDKVKRYLPEYRSAIQVPIVVVGLEK